MNSRCENCCKFVDRVQLSSKMPQIQRKTVKLVENLKAKATNRTANRAPKPIDVLDF